MLENESREVEALWAFLLRLGDVLRPLANPAEVQAIACRMLGEHLAVSRVRYADIVGDEYVVRASYENGVDALQGRGPVATFGAAVLEAYRRRETLAIHDVAGDPRLTAQDRADMAAANTAAFAGVAIHRDGQWAGVLAAHSATPRQWTPADLALMAQVADRVWITVEQAKAESALRARDQQHLLDQTRADALRRSEAKYSGILETSGDAIVSVDSERRITLFNQAAEEVFGYARAEVMGGPLDRLVPERFLAAYRAYLASFSAGGQATREISGQTAPLVGRRKNGEEFPAEATISKVDLDGETILTVVLRDVTAKVRGEIEQRLLSEVGRVLASRVDETLALTSLTRLAVRDFADYSSLYLVGEDGATQRREVVCRDPGMSWLTDLMMRLPIDRRSTHPLWQILDTRRSILIQVPSETLSSHALTDDHRRALEMFGPRSSIGVPLLAGTDVFGALFVASSRASRSFDERDLALMEEIARRAALSLENARLYRAAQKAIHLRNEVLGIVAHDLRSPLGAILMYASLPRPPRGQSERRSRGPAEAIQRSAAHMNRMINDLLDVTRMEAGHLELVRGVVPARDLLAEVIDTHRDRVAAQSVELQAEPAPGLPHVWADKGRALQVFENLIGNAMKVTWQGSITVGAIEMGSEVLFWVKDTGPGIPPEDAPRVFDRFWQAQNARREGAGLGLTIVKGIVEAHRGRVWLESELGVGTSVFFTLPLVASSSSAQPATRARPRRDHQAFSVLVAEDDRDVREAQAAVLRSRGYDVVAVANGREALDHLRAAVRTDLVILDLAMPVMDGWSFLEERSRDPRLRGLPTIVISGQRDVAPRVATAGARFVAKPVEPAILLQMIEGFAPEPAAG
jgi:PAS domain S-box-containing protein